MFRRRLAFCGPPVTIIRLPILSDEEIYRYYQLSSMPGFFSSTLWLILPSLSPFWSIFSKSSPRECRIYTEKMALLLMIVLILSVSDLILAEPVSKEILRQVSVALQKFISTVEKVLYYINK